VALSPPQHDLPRDYERVTDACVPRRPPCRPLIAAGLIAGTTLAIAAPSAAGGPPEGLYYVQSATTGLNAAKNQDTVVQHRPRGNEDHQQWSLRADGSAYRLENTDDPGRCLARADGLAAVVACGSADAGWQIAQAGPSAYTLKDPGADRYLTVPGGDNYADRLQVGGGGTSPGGTSPRPRSPRARCHRPTTAPSTRSRS
jgi:hypothetical protein